MDKKNKILLRIIIVIVTITLISTLILSAVYAKYVSDGKSNPLSAHPAAFEFDMITPLDDEIEVNFAADGEPGTPIGYTMVTKDYDFSVKTNLSNVAADYTIDITFAPKVADKIRQAREDKYADGLWCDYVVLRGVENKKIVDGKEVITVSYNKNNVVLGEEEFGSEGNELTWSYTTTVAPNKNPDDVTGATTGRTYYRLQMIFYNNTMMAKKKLLDENGQVKKDAQGRDIEIYNYDDFLFVTNGIQIDLTSQQINPGFKGTYNTD